MEWQGVSTRLKRLGRIRLPLLLVAAAALSGCAGGNPGANQGPMAANAMVSGSMVVMASAPGDAQTVTFESIDGPPPQVFDRFVRVLETESQTRNVAIVSRDTAAGYRIRSYLSAQVRGGRTIIAWVWDVYDRNQQRTLRLSGEEAGGKAGRDAWAVADDQLLRRIAQTGLISLSGFVNGTAPPDIPSDAPAPGRTGPAIASADGGLDDSATGGSKALSFTAH
jgi:hypothetical protein